MKFRRLALTILPIAVIGLALSSASGDSQIRAAVSIEPLADFTRQVGGVKVGLSNGSLPIGKKEAATKDRRNTVVVLPSPRS